MTKDRRRGVHVGAAWRLLFRDLGLDELSIVRRAGLSPTLLDGDGTYLALDDFYGLCAAVEAEADDPTLAIRIGDIVSIEFFDPALFAAICSPDMNTAATRLGEFKRLVGQFSLDVAIGKEETQITYRCKYRPDLPALSGMGELVFLVAFVRRATRSQVCPRRVTVQQLPGDLDEFTNWFGCPVVSGPAYRVSFAASDASRAFLTHNAPMWESFQPSLRRRMAEADEQRSMTESVEVALFELLPSGRTQMRDVAKELGVGTRTLQRRLASEDTTWMEVLNQTRERLARHYLRSTQMSPAEVSFLLGFEDPNSLFRAFQRWTGTTPEAWRAQGNTAN